MKRVIAIAAALAVIFIFFYRDLLPGLGLNPDFSLPTIGKQTDIKDQAWQTFESYRDAAKAHDLEAVARLSYQLTEVCKDTSKREECNTLMDNVYNVTSQFQKEDFKHVYADGKQVVLVTEPFGGKDSEALAQAIAYFIRKGNAQPQILGMRFCFKQKNDDKTSCFSKEDRDKNGWWDEVEARFYK